jgi:hypothetical protein
VQQPDPFDIFDNEEEYVGVDDEHVYIPVPPTGTNSSVPTNDDNESGSKQKKSGSKQEPKKKKKTPVKKKLKRAESAPEARVVRSLKSWLGVE